MHTEQSGIEPDIHYPYDMSKHILLAEESVEQVEMQADLS